MGFGTRDSGLGIRASERRRELRGALAVAENLREAGRRRQIGTAVDRGDREIELWPFRASGQHDANGMKERLALLPRPSLHLVGDRAKALAVETRRRRQLSLIHI